MKSDTARTQPRLADRRAAIHVRNDRRTVRRVGHLCDAVSARREQQDAEPAEIDGSQRRLVLHHEVAGLARRQLPHATRAIRRRRRERLPVGRKDQPRERLRMLHRLPDLQARLTIIDPRLAVRVAERDPREVPAHRKRREAAARVAPLAHDLTVRDPPNLCHAGLADGKHEFISRQDRNAEDRPRVLHGRGQKVARLDVEHPHRAILRDGDDERRIGAEVERRHRSGQLHR